MLSTHCNGSDSNDMQLRKEITEECQHLVDGLESRKLLITLITWEW